MPLCNDCGNRVAFVHEVEGTETQLYDKDGILDGIEDQQLETISCWCAECSSHNVEFDR